MNNRGFTTVSFFLWMPFLALILFGFAWCFWFMNQIKAMDNICHEGVLKSQEKLVDINNKIMAMNGRAQWLYFEKRTLDVLILTSLPPVAAAARVKKMQVVLEQRVIGSLQKALFARARFEPNLPLYKLRSKISQKHKEISKHWKASSTLNFDFSVTPKTSQLQVKYRDIASVYKRVGNHSKRQQIYARWSLPLASLTPQWLKEYFPIEGHWRGECFSHPHKGVASWKAAIGEGNH